MTVPEMRTAISKVYDTTSWRSKVNKMYDDQVIAIYHNFSERGILNKVLRRERPASQPTSCYSTINNKKETKSEVTCTQLSIFDLEME